MENSSLDETRPISSSGGEPGDTLQLPNEETSQDSDTAPTVPVPTGLVVAGKPPQAREDDSGQTLRLPTAEAEEPATPEDTAPVRVAPPVPPPPGEQPPRPPRRSSPVRLTILFGILALIAIAVISAVAGYSSGINQRKQAEAVLVAQAVDEQYQLGLQDMQAGRFEMARQRFEYVIQLNPNYPGVTEKLADVLVLINATATPTIVVTPTPSPTPDLRGVEELFMQAREHMNNLEWDQAIETLLNLRKADVNYKPVLVDGMLYMSFRNRGVDKILKRCDLEGGIFDLSQAELFGPLDADASSYTTWASLYLTGASFWDLDWGQAVYYLAQVGPAFPNLCDGSGLTAAERYRQALIGYGDFLRKNGDSCGAVEQYQAALSMGPDAKVEEALTLASAECSGAQEAPPEQPAASPQVTPTETSTAVETPLPTEAPPEATPTVEPPPSEPSPTP